MESLKRSRASPMKPECKLSTPKKHCKENVKILEESSTNEIVQGEYHDLFDDDDYLFNDENIENKSNNSQTLQISASSKLDLSKWVRCVVIGIIRDTKNFDLSLTLKDTIKNNEAILKLQSPWSHTKIEISDIVSVHAVWIEDCKSYVVNKDFGLLVTNPDFLVSGTSVVGSLFCKRKAIFQDKFRGIDSDNKIMLIGSIVHELLQIVLSSNIKTMESIEAEATKFLQSTDITYMLYASKMNFQEAENEIKKFLPNIFEFIHQYIYKPHLKQNTPDQFNGFIDSIEDIEENLWIPQLGLKGKIDVSVKINRRGKNKNLVPQTSKLMPLELKTGRASFSMEHKGQVILYQMMLSEIGENVDSGLLLYLKDGIMKEVSATRNEKRDLIMLRNELAYYLTRNVKLTENLIEKLENTFESFQLPDPINHPNACTKCPYKIICSAFLISDKTKKIQDTHSMNKVLQECTEHLKPTDLQYFIFWCGLLSVEEHDTNQGNSLSTLWTTSSEDRSNRNRAIDNLKIQGKVSQQNGRFIHNFISMESKRTKTDKTIDFNLFGLSVGEYVIVSSSKRIAIAAGHIFSISSTLISVNLERDLLKKYSNDSFIIDKYDSQSNNVFNYTNLGLLLDCTEKSTILRSIIIDKIPPEFSNVLPKIIAKEGIQILAELNSIQRKAVIKGLTTKNYMLIKGLPGTGKTQTLVAIIRLFYLMQKTVLITSHTHSAIDNLLLRLKDYDIPFLRLGPETRINSELHKFSENCCIKPDASNPDNLAKIYASFSIVAVTCLGCSHNIFTHRNSFDVCIVDEATQIYQPTIIRPLCFANKFILVGDPAQLPPLVRSKKAQKLGADQSLFHKLDSNEATSILTLQYRMNKIITKLANDLTYKGDLICGNDQIKQAAIILPNKSNLVQKICDQKWILKSLESHIDQSVMVLDTGNCLNESISFSKSINSDHAGTAVNVLEDEKIKSNDLKFQYVNYCDAAIMFALVKGLIYGGYKAEKIGVITPYSAQVDLLRKLKQNFQLKYENELDCHGLEINTIDQYQGRDKDIIIYTCCKTGPIEGSDSSTEHQILADQRRLTVAITRSKLKLIIVGDVQCLKRYTPLHNLFLSIPSRSKIKLENNKLGFSWEKILQDLS